MDSLLAAGRWFLLPPLPWEPPMHLGSAEPTGGLGRIAERSRGVMKPQAREGEREAGDTCSWGTAQDYQVSEPAAKQEAISAPHEGQPKGRVLLPPPDGARVTPRGGTAPTAGAAAAARRRSAESREGPGGGAQEPGGGISGGKAQDLGWERRSACDSKDSQEPPEEPREGGRPMAPRGIWKSSGEGTM